MRRREFLGASLALAGLGGCELSRTPPLIRDKRRARFDGSRLHADVIVYGATPCGIVSALGAASQGASVAIVGGWREKHVGGMLTGGLGHTDVQDIEAFGSWPRRILDDLGSTGLANRIIFDPAFAEVYFPFLLGTQDVTFIPCGGVTEAVMADRQIKTIHTRSGVEASGRVFIDASYEGDLMAVAGVSFETGRGRAGPANTMDGFRGIPNARFGIGKRDLAVNPYVSGTSGPLLPGINPLPRMATGSADKQVQAYNFRLNLTKDPARKVEMRGVPPEGYDPAAFELLFRMVDAAEQSDWKYGRDWTFDADLIKADEIAPDIYDINARGSFSTDAIGLSKHYPNATYAERERIWKQHEAHIRGFFYALGQSNDSRVPKALARDVRAWGFSRTSFTSPQEGDEAGWPYQLYVREARRLDNGSQWTAEDLLNVDHPRDNRTVAMASYFQDSHYAQYFVLGEAGDAKVMSEGTMGLRDPRTARSPLPYSIMVPHADQTTNMLVPMGVAATHQAFSAIRMEMSAMALGEAAGKAAAIMVQGRQGIDAAEVDYRLLSRLLRDTGVVLDQESRLGKTVRKVKARLP